MVKCIHAHEVNFGNITKKNSRKRKFLDNIKYFLWICVH